jgi:hypothetical protein
MEKGFEILIPISICWFIFKREQKKSSEEEKKNRIFIHEHGFGKCVTTIFALFLNNNQVFCAGPGRSGLCTRRKSWGLSGMEEMGGSTSNHWASG